MAQLSRQIPIKIGMYVHYLTEYLSPKQYGETKIKYSRNPKQQPFEHP